ncbi:hypothetical protein DUI87_24991 [Hirundo rustica rustica]|uniref:Uncharacterized protein n=1 Tax=Hirundo rustica rustica TaxID=333673 RepID=A0A3M0JCT5_HIRRU|nr:hypothetical protein DUI87_24991 [Hirundo rustica rustica]
MDLSFMAAQVVRDGGTGRDGTGRDREPGAGAAGRIPSSTFRSGPLYSKVASARGYTLKYERKILKIGCKLMIVVWLDLLLVLVNVSGLFQFRGTEAIGKVYPDISYASYEHFGTKKGQN